jgi:hypothetical protein
MSKPKNTDKPTPANKKKAINKIQPLKTVVVIENTTVEQLPEPLMPELEELVKKNPNRLIGCGG